MEDFVTQESVAPVTEETHVASSAAMVPVLPSGSSSAPVLAAAATTPCARPLTEPVEHGLSPVSHMTAPQAPESPVVAKPAPAEAAPASSPITNSAPRPPPEAKREPVEVPGSRPHTLGRRAGALGPDVDKKFAHLEGFPLEAMAGFEPLLTDEEQATEVKRLRDAGIEEMSSRNPGHRRLNVNGVPVFFPFEPYRSQHALMHNVIKVAREGGHALIESPTGTGKSMALLCSLLAYQKFEGARCNVHNNEVYKKNAMLNATQPEVVEEDVKSTSILKELDNYRRPGSGSSGASGSASRVSVKTEGEKSTTRRASVDLKKVEAKVERIQSGKQEPVVAISDVCAPAVKKETSSAGCANGMCATSGVRQEGTGQSTGVKAKLEDEEDDLEGSVKCRNAEWQSKPWTRRNAKQEDAVNPKGGDVLSESKKAFASAKVEKVAKTESQEDIPPALKVARPPRIFYASRTHAQLTQVVSELKRSGYNPRMTLLASRGEYCLNSYVMSSRTASDRNERCKANVRDSSCRFFHFVEDLSRSMRSNEEIFDIEDLKQQGRAVGGCPYFSAVELYKDAELILCPYNYLIDASIRNARQISVRGHVVVFDEAHNIEDNARESASFMKELSSFTAAIVELNDLEAEERLGPHGSVLEKAYQILRELLRMTVALCNDIIEAGLLRSDDFTGSEDALFHRKECSTKLLEGGFTMESLMIFSNALTTIDESKDEDYGSPRKRGRGSKGSTLRRRGGGGYGDEVDLLMFGRSTGGDSDQNPEDTQKSKKARYGKGRPGCLGLPIGGSLCMSLKYALENPDSFTLAIRRVNNQWESKTEINLWCLNAAVPFKALSDSARAIIVTSGTLTPIDSFRGELNIQFAVAKSLPHVVDVQKQVFTGVVATGPAGVRMDTTYRNTSNSAWQDSVGTAILSYCMVIPGGVLVFFPSYRLLNSLMKRWQQTGLQERLELTKGLVVTESNGRGASFETMMSSYNKAANAPQGALMFGVCRGKISEGMDFKDAAARGVLLVGIPYPMAKDPFLVSKRQWNDRERLDFSRTDVMCGRSWYDMQAFRALNQAVGRCVRHRADYGAIILLDQRFQAESFKKQLPSWVQASFRVGARCTHHDTLLGLQKFFARLQDSGLA